MKSRQIHDDPVTYLLVFEKGDEFSECMQRFAEKAGLSASHFTGLGAFSQVTLGFFDPGKMGHDKIEINEQVEVLALVGDVTLGDAHPKVHPNVIVGCRNGDAKGGHLSRGPRLAHA